MCRVLRVLYCVCNGVVISVVVVVCSARACPVLVLMFVWSRSARCVVRFCVWYVHGFV